jgi:hypothetical protein
LPGEVAVLGEESRRPQQSLPLIQTPARDTTDGATVMVHEIDVPIRVKDSTGAVFRAAYKH